MNYQYKMQAGGYSHKQELKTRADVEGILATLLLATSKYKNNPVTLVQAEAGFCGVPWEASNHFDGTYTVRVEDGLYLGDRGYMPTKKYCKYFCLDGVFHTAESLVNYLYGLGMTVCDFPEYKL
jgi:hypothetical protein